MKCKTCRIFAAVVLTLMISISVADNYLVIPTGKSASCNGPDEVISAGGRCWKDSNLGASRAAVIPSDIYALGDLYQWGRVGEGHQNSGSPTTATLSENDVPGHERFIISTTPEGDWREPLNDKLWQGLGGRSNPCPQGFRIPTKAEWDAEIASWKSRDAAGAFASPLKLPSAGIRHAINGNITNTGIEGWYWTSTISNGKSYCVNFISDAATTDPFERGTGMSVRCIKD